MSAPSLIADLRSLGVELTADGDRLVCRAPYGTLTNYLLGELRTRKAEILAELTRDSLDRCQIEATREALGAVLIRSPRLGEVWLAIDPCMAPELESEEAGRDEPRPVLLAADLGRFQRQPDEAIAARLEVLKVFPGARVLS